MNTVGFWNNKSFEDTKGVIWNRKPWNRKLKIEQHEPH